MPALNASKKGLIVGTTQTTQAAARDATTGTHNDATGGESLAIQWFRSSGRGGGSMRYIRTFLYFNTSGITSTVSSATLVIRGSGTNNDADVIGVKSTAFGGDGGTDLADDDFNNLYYSTTYTNELTSWNTSGDNNFTLTSDALNDIKNNNAFIIALVEADSDYSDTDTSDTADDVGINFSLAGYTSINYTLAPTGYGNNIIGVSSANISTVNAVATANIEKIIST